MGLNQFSFADGANPFTGFRFDVHLLFRKRQHRRDSRADRFLERRKLRLLGGNHAIEIHNLVARKLHPLVSQPQHVGRVPSAVFFRRVGKHLTDVGHLIDAERLFEYRALAMARLDDVDLHGMDQNVWNVRSGAHARPLQDMLEEWKAVRRGAVHLFATFDEATGLRTGRASGKTFTVRTFPWIIAGHELWHRRIIQERYLGGR